MSRSTKQQEPEPTFNVECSNDDIQIHFRQVNVPPKPVDYLESIRIGLVDFDDEEDPKYIQSEFCGHYHRISDGIPVGHTCLVLPSNQVETEALYKDDGVDYSWHDLYKDHKDYARHEGVHPDGSPIRVGQVFPVPPVAQESAKGIYAGRGKFRFVHDPRAYEEDGEIVYKCDDANYNVSGSVYIRHPYNQVKVTI